MLSCRGFATYAAPCHRNGLGVRPEPFPWTGPSLWPVRRCIPGGGPPGLRHPQRLCPTPCSAISYLVVPTL